MTALGTEVRYTPDDLLRLEEEGLYELVDGKLVEKQMGSLAGETAGIITGRLFNYLMQSAAGKLYPENSFECFPLYPGRVRRPDIAIISAARIADVPQEGHCPIAPDLAIEVISANDKIYELDEKLADYRSANIPAVWVVDPKARSIRVRSIGRPTVELEETDTLRGEPVLPGFSIIVSELLPPLNATKS